MIWAALFCFIMGAVMNGVSTENYRQLNAWMCVHHTSSVDVEGFRNRYSARGRRAEKWANAFNVVGVMLILGAGITEIFGL